MIKTVLRACLKTSSRRREEAEQPAVRAKNPPPHVGGYGSWPVIKQALRRSAPGLWPVCGLLFVLTSWAGGQTSEPSSTCARKDTVFTEFFRRSSGWISGDGGLSVPLSDGRVLWLF